MDMKRTYKGFIAMAIVFLGLLPSEWVLFET